MDALSMSMINGIDHFFLCLNIAIITTSFKKRTEVPAQGLHTWYILFSRNTPPWISTPKIMRVVQLACGGGIINSTSGVAVRKTTFDGSRAMLTVLASTRAI